MLGGACIESRLQEGRKIDYVCGASMFSTREVFEKVGPMDERYFLYFEEADWCQRAARLAIACKVCYEAICYHKGSASQTRPSLVLSYYLTRNRLLFIQKNKTTKEKMALFLPVFTQSLKLLFQCTLKTLFAKTTKQKARVARLKAARKGLFDALSSTYHQGHF
jgi:GT2 family glycosyltransferase